MTEDKRPDPKPRKNIRLWQAYNQWYEISEIRKKHLLRKDSVDKGKSMMDMDIEVEFISWLDTMLKNLEKQMINYGNDVGQVWEWVTNIHGLKSGAQAAKLLALIDDISKFDTISKLWRYAGWAVMDGKAERNKRGEKAHYNNILKATCYIIADLFIKHQTPLYVDIYYAEKLRLRELYPEPIPAAEGKLWKEDYTDSHVHRMAMRKMIKIFLSHLWVMWRQAENLPISDPYSAAILGHTNIIEPE